MLQSATSAGLAEAGWILLLIAAVGVAYGITTLIAFYRFFGATGGETRCRDDAVTLLKPLCGDEPNLAANLRTFVDQKHDGPIQVLCGYSHLHDGAASAVTALRESSPKADIATVVSARRHGPSAKVSNLVNLSAEARHPVLVLSDSDMSVGSDYLSRVLQALDEQGVGAVSVLYHGRGDAGFWSRLAAAGISYQFLPNAVFGVWSSLAAPCMGSTIAVRQEILESIGGLESFATHLADDYAIGEAVRRAGLTVSVPPFVITHACAERSFGQLWRQEVRWGATVRGVVPFFYLGSVIAYPLPLSLLGLAATQDLRFGCSVVAAALLLRTLQAHFVDRLVGNKTASVWLLPMRDCLSFAVFVTSLFVRRVEWRGRQHEVRARGRLAIDQESPA